MLKRKLRGKISGAIGLMAFLMAAVLMPSRYGRAEEPKTPHFDATWRVETPAESKIRAALVPQHGNGVP